jgi:uncharacterized LabA/DUF88 family protein
MRHPKSCVKGDFSGQGATGVARVIAYIDGFNLYFGLKSKGWKRYYWLDLPALAGKFLRSGQTLEKTHYFTSRIRDNGRNTADTKRQSTYIDALRARGTEVHEGHYLEKQRQCRQCKSSWVDYEEKMTDVNIAVQLLSDAFDDAFDTAFLISGDSDLTTPVARIRARFPQKQIVVLLPPDRHSKQLQKAASGFLSISEAKLRSSQLPDPVTTSAGFALHRPGGWK